MITFPNADPIYGPEGIDLDIITLRPLTGMPRWTPDGWERVNITAEIQAEIGYGRIGSFWEYRRMFLGVRLVVGHDEATAPYGKPWDWRATTAFTDVPGPVWTAQGHHATSAGARMAALWAAMRRPLDVRRTAEAAA
jgi:hypothetical protein